MSTYKELEHYANYAYTRAEQDLNIVKDVSYIINDLISRVNNNVGFNCDEKVQMLNKGFEDEIKKYLYYYKKEELMMILLLFKNRYRTLITFQSESNVENINELVSRQSDILWLISIVLQGKENEFYNQSFGIENTNLAMAFRLSFFFSILQDNIEHYKYRMDFNKYKYIGELKNFLITGYFYLDEYSDYIDEMNRLKENNPDEIDIKNAELRAYLKEKGINKSLMDDQLSNILYKNIGCKFGDIISFSGINMFSLTKLDKKQLADIKNIELKSIYESGDRIIFCPMDMCANINCFKQFMYKLHFHNTYLDILKKDVNKQIESELRKIQEKSSTYLCYAISELFYINGYKVPINERTKLPMAEISSIEARKENKTINILKGIGDIDILAIDDKKKEILNIEFKYFQPLMNLKKINDKYKNKDRKRYIMKAERRGEAIKNNLASVLKISTSNGDNKCHYKVRTIFVSPRPDYWMLQDKSVEYIGWIDLIRRIKTRDI